MFNKYLKSDKMTYITMYIEGNIISVLIFKGKVKLFSTSNPSMTLIEDDVRDTIGGIIQIDKLYKTAKAINVVQDVSLDSLIDSIGERKQDSVKEFFIKYYNEINNVL